MMREGPPVDEHVREIPSPPAHGFVGREGELREAVRLAETERYLVIRGEHGEGKTTLAAELGRRLLESRRFERIAYVSLEVHHDGPGVRFSIGQQLVPSYRLAMSQDPRLAFQLLERVLKDSPTLVILDDMEAVLPPTEGAPSDPRVYEPAILDQVLALASELRKIGRTTVVFAGREALPEPFHANELRIGALGPDDAVGLVRAVLAAREADRELAAEQVGSLVEAVGAHPGGLVALAGEIKASGLSGAARTLDECEASIGDLRLSERRRPLALGAEIALRTVPEPLRRKLPLLDVFRGGGHLTAIAAVLELDVESDEEVRLAEQLIDAGLAEMLPNNYLRFHPALRAALRAEVRDVDLGVARTSWVEATTQLVEFLCQEQIKSPQLAANLAQLDLRNLLACLEYLDKSADADQVIELANAVESLVGPLGRPQALEHIDALRERASGHLGEWSHEQYIVESAALEMLMDAGRPDDTAAAARRLLHRAETMGPEAYDGADFDIATLHLTLGLAQLMAGESEMASSSFEAARRRFHDLARAGRADAARMEAQALARTGDALRATGFRAPSAEAYRQAVEMAQHLGDRHLVAEVKTQIGELSLSLDRIPQALAAYEEARDIFTELEEHRTVAGIWHQISLVHQSSGRFDAALDACRQALRLEMSEGERKAAATTLGELGTLQADGGRLDDAVESFRRAAEIFAELDDLADEGIARSQIGDKLLRLGRVDEARRELERTIECDAPFGHDAEPWRTFSMLAHVEEAAGRDDAMLAARRKATLAYLRYRRDGGESQVGHGEIFAEVTRAVLDDATAEVAAKLESMLRRKDLPANLKALIPALQAVLRGSRETDLAADPKLYYRDAAELLLQLEELEGARSQASDVYF